jgi:hypothetical protein
MLGALGLVLIVASFAILSPGSSAAGSSQQAGAAGVNWSGVCAQWGGFSLSAAILCGFLAWWSERQHHQKLRIDAARARLQASGERQPN